MLKMVGALTLALCAAVPAFADCVIYQGPYSYYGVGNFKTDGEILYAGASSSTPLAHIEGSVIFTGSIGGVALAHIDGFGIAYDGEFSRRAILNVKGDTVYDGEFGATPVSHSKTNSCTEEQLLLDTAALKKLGRL